MQYYSIPNKQQQMMINKQPYKTTTITKTTTNTSLLLNDLDEVYNTFHSRLDNYQKQITQLCPMQLSQIQESLEQLWIVFSQIFCITSARSDHQKYVNKNKQQKLIETQQQQQLKNKEQTNVSYISFQKRQKYTGHCNCNKNDLNIIRMRKQYLMNTTRLTEQNKRLKEQCLIYKQQIKWNKQLITSLKAELEDQVVMMPPENNKNNKINSNNSNNFYQPSHSHSNYDNTYHSNNNIHHLNQNYPTDFQTFQNRKTCNIGDNRHNRIFSENIGITNSNDIFLMSLKNNAITSGHENTNIYRNYNYKNKCSKSQSIDGRLKGNNRYQNKMVSSTQPNQNIRTRKTSLNDNLAYQQLYDRKNIQLSIDRKKQKNQKSNQYKPQTAKNNINKLIESGNQLTKTLNDLSVTAFKTCNNSRNISKNNSKNNSKNKNKSKLTYQKDKRKYPNTNTQYKYKNKSQIPSMRYFCTEFYEQGGDNTKQLSLNNFSNQIFNQNQSKNALKSGIRKPVYPIYQTEESIKKYISSEIQRILQTQKNPQ